MDNGAELTEGSPKLKESQERKKEPRGNLVEIAVKFLNNPRVVNGPLDQKKAFLKKKGLTDTEIEEAIKKSQTNISNGTRTALSPPIPPPPPHTSHQAPQDHIFTPSPSPSRSHRWSYAALLAVVAGGISYVIYKLFQRYVLSWSQNSEESQSLEEVVSAIRHLQTNVDTAVSNLDETTRNIKEALSEQQEHIQAISTQLSALETAGPQSRMAVKEIQEQISTLKGLLLNRHQFPTPTPPRPHTTAGIPSWQRSSLPTLKTVGMSGEEGRSEEERGRQGEGEGEGEGGEGEGKEGGGGGGEGERETKTKSGDDGISQDKVD